VSRDRNHKPDSPLSAPKLASSVQNASFRSIGFVFSKPPFCDRIWVRPCKNASTLDWVRFFGLLSRTEVASNVQKSLRDVRGTQVVTHPLCPISENWVRACKIAARPRLGSFFRVRHSATGLASSVQNAAATLRSAQAATRATVVRGSNGAHRLPLGQPWCAVRKIGFVRAKTPRCPGWVRLFGSPISPRNWVRMCKSCAETSRHPVATM